MPKNKFEDIIFTIMMSGLMVFGMVVYNVAQHTGEVTGATFLAAVKELPIMWPIAFVLEFFIVGKLARKLAFTFMKPTDRPQFITFAISICICCIMCPSMSLIATLLFQDNPTFGLWLKTFVLNFPMAVGFQLFYCGPFIRLIFRLIFRRNNRHQDPGKHQDPSKHQDPQDIPGDSALS